MVSYFLMETEGEEATGSRDEVETEAVEWTIAGNSCRDADSRARSRADKGRFCLAKIGAAAAIAFGTSRHIEQEIMDDLSKVLRQPG